MFIDNVYLKMCRDNVKSWNPCLKVLTFDKIFLGEMEDNLIIS